MSGIGNRIREAIIGAVPPANPIRKALGGTAGTTSGMDKAMQDHADQQHPVPSRVRRKPGGGVYLPGDEGY